MIAEKKSQAQIIYLILAALFIASLVTSNLIFQKFFYWYPFDNEVFGVKLFVYDHCNYGDKIKCILHAYNAYFKRPALSKQLRREYKKN